MYVPKCCNGVGFNRERHSTHGADLRQTMNVKMTSKKTDAMNTNRLYRIFAHSLRTMCQAHRGQTCFHFRETNLHCAAEDLTTGRSHIFHREGKDRSLCCRRSHGEDGVHQRLPAPGTRTMQCNSHIVNQKSRWYFKTICARLQSNMCEVFCLPRWRANVT